eukprot:GGOE01002457.1.p1 GENE.GGOE01002457.1~~GGOE01002457.1.p1  ORF type:complete len:1080 (+),score=381.05 GGOE01002457.1:57-3296(+)
MPYQLPENGGLASAAMMTPENVAYLAEHGVHELMGKMLQHFESQLAMDHTVKPIRCWTEFLEDYMGKPRSKPRTIPAPAEVPSVAVAEPVILPIAKVQEEVALIHRTLQSVLDTSVEWTTRVQERNLVLQQLMVAFQQVATPVARIIIEERGLPPAGRSIKALPADPDKYLCAGLVVRIAVTPQTVASFRTREAAAKVLGHELKGVRAVLAANIPGLHMPLGIEVRHLGLAAWVSTQLPLTEEDVVYGGLEGGRRMVSRDAEMEFLMQQLGEQLNLKAHRAGLKRATSRVIYGPADIQGYRYPPENRLYLLNLSRLFPPTTPDPDHRSGHLHRLLRPEAVWRHSRPLNPDVFSPYLNTTADVDDVKACTRRVTVTRLPHVIRRLQGISVDTLTPEELVHVMHVNGANCRYLGQLLPLTDSLPVRVMIVLCSEIVARAFRSIVEDNWYDIAHLEGKLDAQYEMRTFTLFHALLDETPDGSSFWADVLLPRICEKYGEPLLLLTKRMVDRPLIFRRSCALLGVRFGLMDIKTFKEFEESGADRAPLGMRVQLLPVAKMPVMPEPTLAERHFLEGRIVEAAAVTETILAKKSKLTSDMSPSLVPVLRSLAKIYAMMGEDKVGLVEQHLQHVLRIREATAGNDAAKAHALRELGEFHLLKATHEAAQPFVEEALRLARQAFGEGHPQMAVLLNMLGSLCFLRGEHKACLDMFKAAMEIRQKHYGLEHPQYADSLVFIGMFYTNQGMPVQAITFLQSAAKIITESGNPILTGQELARIQFHQAVALYFLGRHGEALQLFRECQPGLERALGPKASEVTSCTEFMLAIEHRHAPISMATLGSPRGLLKTQTFTAPSEAGSQKSRQEETRSEASGRADPAAGPSLKDTKPAKPQAQAMPARPAEELQRLLAAGKYTEAIPIMQHLMEAYDGDLAGLSSEEFLDMLTQYAHVLQHATQQEAIQAYKRLVDVKEVMFGLQHPEVALALEDLANSLASHSMYAEAAFAFERAGAIWSHNQPTTSKELADCFEKLANLHFFFGRRSASLRVWDRVFLLRRQLLGDSHEDTQRSKKAMDALYEEIRRLEEG